MYGDSVPADTVGGDLFEYINFQDRYDIDARIRRALNSSKELLKPNAPASPNCNSVDDYMQWLKSRPEYHPELETAYRDVRKPREPSRGREPRWPTRHSRRSVGRCAGPRRHFGEDRVHGARHVSTPSCCPSWIATE